MAERNYSVIAQFDFREIPNGKWTSDDVRISMSYEDGPLGPEGFKVVYPDGYTYTVYFFTRAAWDAYRLTEGAPENPTDDWWDNAEGRIVDDPRASAQDYLDEKILHYHHNNWIIKRHWINPNEVTHEVTHEVTMTESEMLFFHDEVKVAWSDRYEFWETPKTRVVKSFPTYSRDIKVIGSVMVERPHQSYRWLTSFDCLRLRDGRGWERLPAYRIGEAKAYDSIVDAIQYGEAMMQAFREAHPHTRSTL